LSALTLSLFLSALTAGGCGYSFKPLTRGGVRSVHVPIFENDSRRREIEFPLTEAVARELRRAGYRLAAAGSADAHLLGRISEVEETIQSEDPAGSLAQGRITVKVRYQLVKPDRRKVIAEGEAAEGGEVIFARGENRPQGLDRAVLELARAIVRGLEPPPP
jgi:outer membrane lipopolysaccharide assembly protein LptE/RlpB